jgi:hypothetical protein
MVTTPQEMAERHARGLAKLQEITLRACEVLGGRLEAAETPEATATVALSLQRMTRACRQAMLVEAKLMREARALGREDVAAAEKAKVEAYKARKIRARHEASLIVAEACESAEDAESVMDEVEARLDGYLADPAYAGEDLAPLVHALCEDLGLEFKDAAEEPAAPADEPQAAPPADPSEADAPEFDAAPPQPEPPKPGPRLIQAPKFGWYPDPDSS